MPYVGLTPPFIEMMASLFGEETVSVVLSALLGSPVQVLLLFQVMSLTVQVPAV